MFTGLVETQATVMNIVPEQAGKRFILSRPATFDDLKLGDSVAINGCCLTVVGLESERMEFQAGRETLLRTTLDRQRIGSRLNCERAMRLGDRVGGHLVSGHIDGIGSVSKRTDDDQWSTIYFQAPAMLMRQMVSKGSIAVDGTSLTLVDVNDTQFSVALIPHTLDVTTLGQLRAGDPVNLETDLLAKYVQRQLDTTRFSGEGNIL